MRPCRILWHCIVSLLFFSIIGCRETAVPASGKSNQSSDVAPAVNNKDSSDPVNSDSNPSSPTQPQTNNNNTNGGGGGGGSPGNRSNNSTSSPAVSIAGPNSTCGNGVQEITARSSQQCIYDLYGSTINPDDGSSSLYFFDKQTGVGFLIGAISEQLSGIERVGAIDFSPDGVLYGVGIRSLDDKSVLITIDCATGQATIIGETGIESIDGAGQITDIDFDSQGHLYAFFDVDEIITADSNLIPTENILGLLDRVSGAFSVIGPAGMQISSSDVGHGIASAPFAVDSLYHAGSSYLSTLNESTGVATNIDLLDFPAPALGAPFITAMDNDGFNNVTYVAVRNNTATKLALDLDPSPYENYVGVLDRVTGAISWLPIGPQLAPAGLDGLAVNQHYEECDLGGSNPVNDPPVPEGADCTEDCHIFESDCADGDDNDGDGRIDCLDSDCNNQSCDDELACTTDDVCVNEACTGTAKPCIDENPCSVDGVCNEPSGDCDYSQLEDRPDFGDCEVDGLACTIGRCVDNEGPTCFEQNRALIHEEDNGCRDSDPCTADSCVETYSPYPCASSICIQKHEPVSSIAGFEEYSSEAQCVHESMVGAVCQPSGNSCLIGICTLTGSGTPSSPYDVECLNTQPYNCGQTTDAENEVCLESGCSANN